MLSIGALNVDGAEVPFKSKAQLIHIKRTREMNSSQKINQI
jgi:hypothetical protein